MCVIIDTNMIDGLLDTNNKDMKPLRDWLEKGKGKLVSPQNSGLQKEYEGRVKLQTLLVEYNKKGVLKVVLKESIKAAEERLLDNSEIMFQSDDRHIIVLAKASGAKLLASQDQDLESDFKDIIRGKIYKDQSHRHLLSRRRCP